MRDGAKRNAAKRCGAVRMQRGAAKRCVGDHSSLLPIEIDDEAPEVTAARRAEAPDADRDW
jgi:hypothetical protein